MNEENKIYTISGVLINSKNHQGIAGLRVEAWDKDLIFDDLVGSAISSEQGAFQIEFGIHYFQELFLDCKPDLYFKIFHGSKFIDSTENSVLWNINQGLTQVNIEVDYEDNQGSLKINSYEELLAHESQIIERIANTPNGGNLFLIHPFLLFEDIGVELSENAKAEILATEPRLAGFSSLPYQALKASNSPQNVRFHIRGLFARRSV